MVFQVFHNDSKGQKLIFDKRIPDDPYLIASKNVAIKWASKHTSPANKQIRATYLERIHGLQELMRFIPDFICFVIYLCIEYSIFGLSVFFFYMTVPRLTL